MKNYLYKVKFIDGSESIIYSSNPVSAAILASADRIKSGKDRRILSIESDHGNPVEGSLQFAPLNKSNF
jgi:hypothetical protein